MRDTKRAQAFSLAFCSLSTFLMIFCSSIRKARTMRSFTTCYSGMCCRQPHASDLRRAAGACAAGHSPCGPGGRRRCG